MSRVGPRSWHSRDPVVSTRRGPRKGDACWHPGVRYHAEEPKPKPQRVGGLRLTLGLWARKPLVFRSLLLEAQGGRCGICGEPCEAGESNVDHIVPVSRGGPCVLLNLRATHIVCNGWRDTHECPYEPNIALVLETRLANDDPWVDWCHWPHRPDASE